MIRYWILIAVVFIVSCGNNEATVQDEKPVDARDFFAMFPPLSLPYHTDDTSLYATTDTTHIDTTIVHQFLPDTAVASLTPVGKSNVVYGPVGKIEKQGETYLLLAAKAGKQTLLSALLYNDKQQYVNAMPLVSAGTNDSYSHSVDINTEPTFTVTREKTVKDKYLFTKKGYAYSAQANGFIEVINDSNEESNPNSDIFNPIDTLPANSKYSGDYVKDKKNFISVRDAAMPGKYQFFLHFEKKGNDCSGEMKGTFTMVAENKAVFEQSGDPCVIDFTFSGSSLKVKERGSCGNHRGITCLIEDSYRKKKSDAKKGA